MERQDVVNQLDKIVKDGASDIFIVAGRALTYKVSGAIQSADAVSYTHLTLPTKA